MNFGIQINERAVSVASELPSLNARFRTMGFPDHARDVGHTANKAAARALRDVSLKPPTQSPYLGGRAAPASRNRNQPDRRGIAVARGTIPTHAAYH
jgi:hypothetical protein